MRSLYDSIFEAVRYGEFGTGAPQQVSGPIKVLRGTEKLKALPSVIDKTGALKGAGGAAKPPIQGMPRTTPGALALSAKKAALPGDKNLRNLGSSIDAFREIEAIVEAWSGRPEDREAWRAHIRDGIAWGNRADREGGPLHPGRHRIGNEPRTARLVQVPQSGIDWIKSRGGDVKAKQRTVAAADKLRKSKEK
jgi:hypothetical protein